MRVVDAACTCLPSLGQKFLTGLLVGTLLGEDMQQVAAEIRGRYFGITQRAMIAALEDIQRRLTEFRKTQKDKPETPRKG